MVLGTSDVRLIDMTRAFASVANKGIAVTPFGITKVTATNEVIFQHEVDRSRVLVAPYVAAQMTDLLQTAVNTGTGRAAQIGRPVAGKTGTTSSSKDGWFLGFSSGLTTGVWMGRDDARPISGLQGGTAPARAFAQFMTKAVAKRPIEQFETQVTLPEWQLEPDEESYYGAPDDGVFIDENGNPIASDGVPVEQEPEGVGIERPSPRGERPVPEGYPAEEAPAPPPAGQQMDQDWIDRVTGRDPERDPQRDQRPRRDPRAQPPPEERPYQ
jgi:penicillin-binding protein 1A